MSFCPFFLSLFPIALLQPRDPVTSDTNNVTLSYHLYFYSDGVIYICVRMPNRNKDALK